MLQVPTIPPRVRWRPAMAALVLLAAGGLVYSAGFVIYVIERPNPWPGIFGFHEIWHVLVAVAAFLHYLLMYLYVLRA